MDVERGGPDFRAECQVVRDEPAFVQRKISSSSAIHRRRGQRALKRRRPRCLEADARWWFRRRLRDERCGECDAEGKRTTTYCGPPLRHTVIIASEFPNPSGLAWFCEPSN